MGLGGGVVDVTLNMGQGGICHVNVLSTCERAGCCIESGVGRGVFTFCPLARGWALH